MGTPVAYRSRAGSRLFIAYAVASLVPVLVLGIVLSSNYRREGHDRALSQGRAQAAVIEQMAIAPMLGKQDLREGLDERERDGLMQATQLAVFAESVVRLRVRSFDGRVVFSDDGTTAGALRTSDPAFRRAAVGERDVSIVDPDGRAKVLRALLPIVPNATGRATGVLELYLPYAPIAAQVTAQLHGAYWRLAAALAVLYLVLALISWSTTRRLRRHASDREYEALHDGLTGLPNRTWFRREADAAVDQADPGCHGAIVLLDLDRFKEVNDTLGHHAGDELLQVAAQRLREALRTDDLLARLGGDEFGIVLPGVRGEREAAEVVGDVRRRLVDDVELDGVRVAIEASFGVALFPDHGTTTEQLLQRADAAMYQAKRLSAGIVIHDPAALLSTVVDTDGLAVHGELRRAIDEDELRLVYQPKFSVGTGDAIGLEALVRWEHPRRGLLGPAAFLPEAERSSLIQPLTEWVLRRALADRAEWCAAGVVLPVSVNVSARNLEAAGFPERVLDLLDAAGATPADIVIEVTETALAANAEAVNAAVGILADAGVAISVDDFGMGSTSLSGLRTLPVSELKIDRAFVSGLDGSPQDRSIVRAIIELAHGLGFSVTAEGVETPAVQEWLRRAGCDTAQGYHLARPAPWAELLPLLQSDRDPSATWRAAS
jgi:diguanylate cyclase